MPLLWVLEISAKFGNSNFAINEKVEQTKGILLQAQALVDSVNGFCENLEIEYRNVSAHTGPYSMNNPLFTSTLNYQQNIYHMSQPLHHHSDILSQLNLNEAFR